MIGRFPIEAGQVLAFARAIGDQDPQYARVADTEVSDLADVVPPPPTYVRASAHFDPEYPLRPRPGARWFDPDCAVRNARRQRGRRRGAGAHGQPGRPRGFRRYGGSSPSLTVATGQATRPLNAASRGRASSRDRAGAPRPTSLPPRPPGWCGRLSGAARAGRMGYRRWRWFLSGVRCRPAYSRVR
jgi:hypothetical protein